MSSSLLQKLDCIYYKVAPKLKITFLSLLVVLTACGGSEPLHKTADIDSGPSRIQSSLVSTQALLPPELAAETTEVPLPFETAVPETKAEPEPKPSVRPLYRDPATFPAVDPNQHYVALTFDDGPHVENTPRLLDALSHSGVLATFFVVGDRLQHPGNFAVAQRAFQEGHLLANHSWSHSDLTLLKPEELRHEIDGTDDLIRQITGDIAPFIRPPYGSFNSNVQEQVYRPLALWSIDPRDWDASMTEDSIVQAVLNQLEARKPYARGDIVLLHDIHAKSVDAAIALLQILPQRGYTLVRLDDLLYMAGEQLKAGQAYYALP